MNNRSSSLFGWMGVVLITVTLFAMGCGSSAHVEKSPSAQMDQYKTYTWVKQTENNGKPNKRNYILEDQIRSSVDEQMQKKGYYPSNNDPDLLISTDWVVEKNRENRRSPVYTEPYQRSYYNYRTGRYHTYYFPSQFAGYENYTSTSREGTLTVTLIDASTDKTVWQGWGTRELNQSFATQKDVDKNVQAIFKKFD